VFECVILDEIIADFIFPVSVQEKLQKLDLCPNKLV
jgi:hypothetical protein